MTYIPPEEAPSLTNGSPNGHIPPLLARGDTIKPAIGQTSQLGNVGPTGPDANLTPKLSNFSRRSTDVVDPITLSIPGELVLGWAMQPDGEEEARHWAGAYFSMLCPGHRAASVAEIASLQGKHHRDNIERWQVSERAYHHVKVAVSGKPSQENFRRSAFTKQMIGLGHVLLYGGLAVLIIALSSYILNAGLLDFAATPWKAYFFSSLPLSAVFAIKTVTSRLRDKAKRRFIFILATFGLLAVLIWMASFSQLTAPDPGALSSLPGAHGLTWDAILGTALVFSHLTGEVAIGALIFLYLETLMHGDRKRVVQPTEEYVCHEAALEQHIEAMKNIDEIGRDADDYLQQIAAAKVVYTGRVVAAVLTQKHVLESILNNAKARAEAAKSEAVAKFLSSNQK